MAGKLNINKILGEGAEKQIEEVKRVDEPVKEEVVADQSEPQKKRGPGRPRKDDLKRGGSEDGLSGDWNRCTLILTEGTIEKLKDYAYTERLLLKDAGEKILSEFLAEYEKNNKLLKKPRD